MMQEKTRINKYLSEVGYCSRRAADKLLEEGRIKINGEIPEMEVHIIENEFTPGGVGEPGLPPIAPALGNAIYHLTGNRIRKLPVDLATLS